jgi:hypothetical protein
MPRGTEVPITPEVLSWAVEESGYSDEQIAQFREDNVIGEFDYYDEIPE